MASMDLSQVAWKISLTSAEAGALTGRDPKTIAALCELGVIRASRDNPCGPWRIARSALDEWVNGGHRMQAVAS